MCSWPMAPGVRLLDLCKDTGTDMLAQERSYALAECQGTWRQCLPLRLKPILWDSTQATRPDHVLVSVDMLPLISSVVVNTGRRDFDHHPTEMTLQVNVVENHPVSCVGQPRSRVRWQPTSRNALTDALRVVASASFEACQGLAVTGTVDATFQTLDAGIRQAAAASNMHACPGCQWRPARVDAPSDQKGS